MAGKLEYDGFSTAKFTPYSDLLPGLNYTLTLTGAEDLNGNPLNFNGWSFMFPTTM
ncbi:MAG: Ig-like domain-containing protein [Desulfobacterales bacterium]|nr:Ig-like domain-containing protein [Desulfobacterales bacterium]